ncbi:Glucose 1-dehydrogenase 1 [Pirellula sp. SH-Sr6A]|uniref:SDR family NAD(P)-dependent oxidoreductase n=1 Tax=Pirellula sp. SH-Sr6A TaxID=1632865 RepID=UPI00078DF0F8|nr:SDR family oxidoreductase [Pirellula sp. SH-Sr6A]AMV35033.1 Glucose 1-dehydrogenase 1 [Pirellula sp. SH-Sr6A]
MDLRGRTALITGGSQGVGAAMAKRIAKAGGNVVIHGKSEDGFANETVDTCRAMGVEATLICSDLTLPIQDTLRVLSPESHPALSQVSLLVNNAGVFLDSSFLEMDETTWCKTFRINVEVGYFLTQAFAKRWITDGTAGRVLFTGSINGLLAEPEHTAYDASKAAVGGMVRSLCVALAPHRIRVNSIAPGLVRTPLTNQILDARPDVLRWMELHTPNGQVPDAEVCGGLAVFLLSDEAEHIHGQTIFIDGGMSIWQQPDLPIA